VGQVRASTVQLMDYAKGQGVAVILAGHVTKDGSIAGPKTLEHLVDAVVNLEGERFAALRLLRASKNRFGSTEEIGVFEMAEGGLVEVADPAEETFPYAGRTEFTDPETGDKLTAGRAEMLGDEYRLLYTARRQELAGWCKRLGWSFTVNHTDRLASDALVRLHLAMTADGGHAGKVSA